jgi:hypothetical protein
MDKLNETQQETKTVKNDENIENMYKNKNKFFNNNEKWAYIYKK